jgi:Tc toxin complex TcA C-terminal TcB-binding domain/ABC toxin N-terminal region
MNVGTQRLDGQVAAQGFGIGPLLPAGGGGSLPADTPPSVTMRALPGRVVAGQPVSVDVVADEGTHWFRDPQGDPDSEPIVAYSATTLTLDGATLLASGPGGGGTFSVVFPQPGDHALVATGSTTQGVDVVSRPVAVRVLASGPPVFTVESPADGDTVDLNEGGGSLDVRLTFPAAQFFPLTVDVMHDGVKTSATATGVDALLTVTLSPMPLGARAIFVQVSDRDGQAASVTRTVNGRDVAPPHLVVEFPTPSANVMADVFGNATVTMHGTAADSQSGMAGGQAGVEWALSPAGARTPAQPAAGNDFSTWHADVALTGFGAHTIHVWATDAAGNTTDHPVSIPVTLISSFVPATLEERLDEREYLAALLAFAQQQVTVTIAPPTPLDTPTLVAALGQPLDRLSQPLSADADRGRQEINQLRVPVEVLRAQIVAGQVPTGPGAAGEVRYREAAYAALLAAVGTSYQELRLARAFPDVRRALADRLGIGLSAAEPDELDRLVLDGAALTEAALETVFGLPDTTVADPLRVRPTSQLLTWQLAGLTVRWAQEDQHPTLPRAFATVADPDVIDAGDVVAASSGDPIRALLVQRSAVLTDFASNLDQVRAAAADAGQALAAIVAQTLPGVDLAALEADERQGVDISAELDAAGLSRGGFRYLRTVAALTATGTVTEAEWADAIAVLTSAHKHTLVPAWRAEETAFVLSPDAFVAGGTGPTVNPYRVSVQARPDWQSVLRARFAQRQDLLDSSAAAVAAAEQAALPILRDALLSDFAAATAPGTDVGEQLSARYFVDVLSGGSLRTTRIRQAIESVQALLVAKRSGELAADHPAAGWTITDLAAFSNAWVWLGEWSSWRSATQAFLFPERHLDPSLLVQSSVPGPGEQQSPLATLFEGLRGSGPFSADVADQLSRQYLRDAQESSVFDHYLDPLHRAANQDALRAHSEATTDTRQKREIFWAVPMLLAQRLQSAGDFTAALDWFWLLYPYDEQPVSIYDPIDHETVFGPDLTFPANWTELLDPFDLVAHRPAPYTRATLLAIIGCHVEYADSEFTRETDESVANARSLYLTALRLLADPALQPQQPTNPGEPALAIPELDAFRARATVQLAKLRQGRSITGIPRTQVAQSAATIGQATPYRFKTLIDRARQLTAQAIQMEAGYQAALEKYDDRSLQVFDALKAIDLAQAQVSLAVSRVQEATDGVTAAQAQKDKADTMVSAYGDLIDAPPNQYEQNLLDEYPQLRDAKNDVVEEDMAINVMQAAQNASNIWGEITSGFTTGALSLGIATAAGLKFRSQEQQNNLEAQIQANQLKAGIEQRKQEWRLQQTAAAQESQVAAAQLKVAGDQVTIAVQEQGISELQHDQAVARLKFLSDQFTNADLFQWLSNTLGGVYRYFLQQATATARLAQAQLAFERAEPAQTLIRDDYWRSPEQLTSTGQQPDRRGLAGAEQLSEDLTRLDEYAFSTGRRRLNLSQTFSLAREMPVEFLDFRRTGTLAFATPMSLFDADFPGHYLRQICRVGTSVVAIIPHDRGIRATLYSNGVSRVVTGRDGSFGEVIVRHDPSLVALTSPINATGVFELDVQSELLLPFEASGVDTTWELRLPRAANPLDYSSIVDVLFTIEYTALADDDYRRQVVTRLNTDRDRGADRVFSLAQDFPDAWYDLNNPADPAHRQVTLTLRDPDFPLGVDGLGTTAVAARLVGRDAVPDTTVSLHRGPAGGDALASGGIASTRRGAAAWIPLVGPTPVGDWQLGFTADADPLFTSGALDDIVLIVSWSGRSPAWEV